ncbi:hypothetical protein [Luteimonas vadosa]|uniref:hypothetical protein n=1 Tax=Luteimonas vadosa TaxID=1165507 RepID=UPI0031E6EA50
MDSEDRTGIDSILAQQVAAGAGADAVADAVVAAWHEIDGALRPVLGQRGVAALYGRCVYVVATRHPWIEELRDGASTQIDFAALTSVLAGQPAGQAAAGGSELLQTLYELLASLLGPALTEQLLHNVRPHLSGGSPAQDTSS